MNDRVLGIAGCEQHREVRQPLLGHSGEFRAFEAARHDDIGEEHIDRDAALYDAQRTCRVDRLEDPVTEFGEGFVGRRQGKARLWLPVRRSRPHLPKHP